MCASASVFSLFVTIYICCNFFLYIKVFFLFKISFCSLSFSLRLQNKRTTLHMVAAVGFCKDKSREKEIL